MNRIVAYIFLVLFLFTSVQCKKIFEFSPYEVNLDEKYLNTTLKNLQRLNNINQQFDDTVFTVGLLSDLHYFYDDLRAARDFIHSRNKIDFVIITGDLVDQGLEEEFKMLHDAMSSLSVPYLTVIGNHDYLSNGENIYDKMFGPRNYFFSFSNTKFIMFDDVFWESEKRPDFAWLANQFNDRPQYAHVIVCNHIPAHTDQFDAEGRNTYYSILSNANVELSINGHQHLYERGNFLGEGLHSVILPSVEKRYLVELTVSPSKLRLDTLKF
jgi:3',5'-cyclic-AMP phosphodiesterase